MAAWWDGLVEVSSDATQVERLRALRVVVAAAANGSEDDVDAASRKLLAALLQRRPDGTASDVVPYTAAADPQADVESTGSAAGSALPARTGATERYQWAWCDVAVSGAADASCTDELARPAAGEAKNSAEANPREVPVRRTADLLIGVLDACECLGEAAPGQCNSKEPVSSKLSTGGASACVRYGSGTALCVIEQPCPELRGALVWVAVWNIVRSAAGCGQRDTVASSSCACSCAPAYVEIRDLVVLRRRPASEWQDMTPPPTVVSVADLEHMESERRQSKFARRPSHLLYLLWFCLSKI